MGWTRRPQGPPGATGGSRSERTPVDDLPEGRTEMPYDTEQTAMTEGGWQEEWADWWQGYWCDTPARSGEAGQGGAAWMSDADFGSDDDK